MKQNEIFTFLADQVWIDNYKWYQETLKKFKSNKKICLEQRANFKKYNKFFRELLNDNNHCQLMIRKYIKETQESIESSERTLIKIENNIIHLNDILKEVNFSFPNDNNSV